MKSCDARGLYETVWLKAIQPLVPSMLQWSGISSVEGGTLTSGPGKKGGCPGGYGRNYSSPRPWLESRLRAFLRSVKGD